MQFVTKNSSPTDFDILHGNKGIAMADNTKFLGLTLDSTLSWKTHIDSMAPKLSSATFVQRFVNSILSLDTLKMVYFSYFHSIMT